MRPWQYEIETPPQDLSSPRMHLLCPHAAQNPVRSFVLRQTTADFIDAMAYFRHRKHKNRMPTTNNLLLQAATFKHKSTFPSIEAQRQGTATITLQPSRTARCVPNQFYHCCPAASSTARTYEGGMLHPIKLALGSPAALVGSWLAH